MWKRSAWADQRNAFVQQKRLELYNRAWRKKFEKICAIQCIMIFIREKTEGDNTIFVCCILFSVQSAFVELYSAYLSNGQLCYNTISAIRHWRMFSRQIGNKQLPVQARLQIYYIY